MTQKQRERWDAKTLAAVRKNLRKSLAILTFRPVEDKNEIETDVMTEMGKVISKVPDDSIERERSTFSYEMEADSLALGILQEQDMRREMLR